LYAIIRELEEITQQLQPMEGIGMEFCITKLKRLREKYLHLRNMLA